MKITLQIIIFSFFSILIATPNADPDDKAIDESKLYSDEEIKLLLFKDANYPIINEGTLRELSKANSILFKEGQLYTHPRNFPISIGFDINKIHHICGLGLNRGYYDRYRISKTYELVPVFRIKTNDSHANFTWYIMECFIIPYIPVRSYDMLTLRWDKTHIIKHQLVIETD